MKKYLLTIEFRYRDVPKYKDESINKTKNITIGIYDNFENACENGNLLLKSLEDKFHIHVFPNGKGSAQKQRFSKNGGIFGGKKTLITNLAYLKTSFSFFVEIKTLKYDNINDVINDVVNSEKRYSEYKKQIE